MFALSGSVGSSKNEASYDQRWKIQRFCIHIEYISEVSHSTAQNCFNNHSHSPVPIQCKLGVQLVIAIIPGTDIIRVIL